MIFACSLTCHLLSTILIDDPAEQIYWYLFLLLYVKQVLVVFTPNTCCCSKSPKSSVEEPLMYTCTNSGFSGLTVCLKIRLKEQINNQEIITKTLEMFIQLKRYDLCYTAAASCKIYPDMHAKYTEVVVSYVAKTLAVFFLQIQCFPLFYLFFLLASPF